MKTQKSSSAPLSMILFIGVIAIFMILMTIFAVNQGIPSTEVADKMGRMAFFEKAKSILNTLNNVEAGQVEEFLPKPTRIELKITEAGKYLVVGEFGGSIHADIEPSILEKKKIMFEKKAGEKIKLKGG